jgi:hypothetical protein
LVSTTDPTGVPSAVPATDCAVVVVVTCESGMPSTGESRSVESVA